MRKIKFPTWIGLDNSDGPAVPVRWRGKTRLPESDKPVQVEFRLRKASLYTFSFLSSKA